MSKLLVYDHFWVILITFAILKVLFSQKDYEWWVGNDLIGGNYVICYMFAGQIGSRHESLQTGVVDLKWQIARRLN